MPNTAEGSADLSFGVHESYEYYQECSVRERNKGLFTADQNLNNRNQQSARSTRQRPNGGNGNDNQAPSG